MERIIAIRDSCFADDVPIHDAMTAWSDDELCSFFESGGDLQPSAQPPASAAEQPPAPPSQPEEATGQPPLGSPIADQLTSAPSLPPGPPTPLPPEPEEATSQPPLEPPMATAPDAVAEQLTPAPSLPPGPPTPLPPGLEETMSQPPLEPPMATAPDADQPPAVAGGADAAAQTAEELERLPVKRLKQLCTAAAVPTDGCTTKEELVQRALQAVRMGATVAPETGASPSSPNEHTTGAADIADWFSALSTKELKKALVDAGVDTSSCFERVDFEGLARLHPHAGSDGGKGGGGKEENGGDNFWSGFSAKALKTLLEER